MELAGKRGEFFREKRKRGFCEPVHATEPWRTAKNEFGGVLLFLPLGMFLMGRFGVKFDWPGSIVTPVLRTPFGLFAKKWINK